MEDETTAADIYFIEDRVSGGVTYPREDIYKEAKDYRSLAGETLAQIRGIDYPLWRGGNFESGADSGSAEAEDGRKVKQPAIYYISAQQALMDGFEKVIQIQSLDQGRLLITYQNDLESRVYIYDTADDTDFYSGFSFQDFPHFRVKQLEDNKTAVILEEKILFVDTESFKLLDEIKYPEKISMNDLDISSDGQTIVYLSKQGLTVSDSHFGNGRVIVEAKIGEDPNGMDSELPRYPLFSPDSSQILYRMVGYEWLVGTGIISLDGSAHKYFKADNEETTYTQWYDSNNIYSNGPAYGDFSSPQLYNIETGEKTYLVKDIPKDKRIEYYLTANSQLFYLETGIEENAVLKFGYYDIAKQAWHELLEIPGSNSFDFHWSAYDKENNNFGLIVRNHPLWVRAAILVGLTPLP